MQEFQEGEGAELHKALVARDEANPTTSYINQWWFDLYVSDRRPLPLNFTPQITFKDDPVDEKNCQAQRAANMVASSVSPLTNL